VIVKLPRHRPKRHFPDAKRIIVECELNECIHCDMTLVDRPPWHMRKTVQTINSAVFVAGRSKECVNTTCTHFGKHYYASGVLKYSALQNRNMNQAIALIHISILQRQIS